MEKPLPLPFPAWMRALSQPVLRTVLLELAGYSVTQESELPNKPSLLALYPHGEHANSLLLPTQNILYLAGADYWYGAAAVRAWAAALVGNSIAVDRSNGVKPSTVKALQKAVRAGYHVGWYPQGTRAGRAESLEELTHQPENGASGRHLQAKGVTLAHLLQIPMVPVGLVYPEWYQPEKGGQNAWERLRTWDQRPVHITVRIGEPIAVEKGEEAAAFQLLAMSLFTLSQP